MSATYRLPDSLGGGECTIVSQDVDRTYRVRVWVKTGDDVGDFIEVPRSLLVEVEPQLPPEPPVGSVVRCHGEATVIEYYERARIGWLLLNVFTGAGVSWAELHRLWPTVTLLIPDPAAGVEPHGMFPANVDAPRAMVDLLSSGGVRLRIIDSHDESASVGLNPELTEALARTLLAAARAARAS
jgi:hypothetical protein